MTGNNSVALSDYSFFSKVIMFISWLIKSCVIFSLFFALIPLKYYLYSKSSNDYLLYFIGMILLYCLAFLIYYVISEGILKEMFIGFIITIIGIVIAFFIPPVGIVIAIIGIISLIKKIISVVKMIPMLILGFLFAVLLFSDEIFMSTSIYLNRNNIFLSIQLFKINLPITKIMSAYIVLSAITSLVLSFKYSLKNAMLRQVVIFMAIPITALIIWLIKTSLSRALYNPTEIQQTSMHHGKIWINYYYKGDGTLVHGYWRRLPHKS